MTKIISPKKVILASFLVDILDIFINLAVMLLTGSIVMTAELLQGVSDMTASGLLLIGVNRSKKEAYLWTLLSALIMLLIASSFSLYFGYQRFINPEPIQNIVIAYIALIVSAISNGYAFLLSVKSGLKNIMTKNTFVLDLMGMSAAIVGLIALILYQLTGELRFDGVGAMGIGLVLGILSIRLVLNILKNR